MEAILVGFSKGVFACVAIVAFALFFGGLWTTFVQAIAISRGHLRFTDASRLAQWVYLTFFNDTDAGGFA